MPRAPKKVKRQACRPLKHIDWDEVDKMLLAQVPGTWIASAIGVCSDTLYTRCELEKGMTFSEYSQRGREHGKSIGMQKQFQGMLRGNPQITLHWAAHHLDQSKKHEVKQEITQKISQKAVLELPDNDRR